MTKIVTHFEYPPIPIRQFDWCAIDDDTYDGEGCPIGPRDVFFSISTANRMDK